ncbi:polysaccharide biosynthesis tyrosine autokinase [Paludibacter sp. 221]|uniref:GumC family protein n=1 Tax=Paludibacter sp. 221 TaxID=2302939 RepID=UPI0013CF9667|nr:polysaccharide biosynthesis tyrosine autokinase [Paludibacter sp. 221]NDV46424.1 polysaccharide biosynthesis tyrosine autokinase [Paludibacter sp. 221]
MDNNIRNTNTAGNDFFDIKELIVKYIKNWHWFLISVFICVAIAAFFLMVTLPKYQVETTFLLKDEKQSGLISQLAMLDAFGLSGSSKEIEDEIQVLTSKTMMSTVIKTLNLETEYFIKEGVKRSRELYSNNPIQLTVPESFNDTSANVLGFYISPQKKGFEIELKARDFKQKYKVDNLNTSINTPYGVMTFTQLSPLKEGAKYRIVTYPVRILSERYSKDITIASISKRSSGIRIATESGVPSKAKIILNTLVDFYNEETVKEKNLITTSTDNFIDERVNIIEKELYEVEAEVEKYKIQNSLTDISSEAALFLQSVYEYDKRQAEIQTQINLVEYINEYVNDEKNKYGLIPANLGIEDESLILLSKEYNDALLQRMTFLRTTNEQNPIVAQLESTLDALRGSIVMSVKSILDGLNIAKADLEGKDSQLNARINDMPTQEREYIEIKRIQEVKQALYLFLLQKKEENKFNLMAAVPPTKVLDSAYASIDPVSPRKMIILVVAVMLGLIFPIVVIYLKDLLNDKITGKKEFQKLVKAPLLGEIGISKESAPVVVKEGKANPVIEMFRQLRTNLQFEIAGKKHPVILVTSSVAGEGKSFVAINLALSLAMLDKKVALLGMDLRNPMLADYMDMEKDRQGITMYLSDSDLNWKDMIKKSVVTPNLYVMQAGPTPPNPAELLANKRLDEMIGELKETFDYIIIDSAPVGMVSDTFQINRLVDNTIYVSRQGYTTRELTGLINDIYDNNKLNNMSTVLNGTSVPDTYYGYGNKKRMK